MGFAMAASRATAPAPAAPAALAGPQRPPAPTAAVRATHPRALTGSSASCRRAPLPSRSVASRALSASSPRVAPPPPETPRSPVLVVDNYDSFTYNLCQYLGDLGCEYDVITNDEKTVDEIIASNPVGILLSPGPGTPDDSGVTLELVERLGPAGYRIFGVCMGLQCIGQASGGKIVRAPSGVMHGKPSLVYHTDTGVLKGLPNPFRAARYHSLVIDRETCPDCLEVTAWTEDGSIMAARHKEFPNVEGVQFHPESIITESGMTIMRNFVDSLPTAPLLA